MIIDARAVGEEQFREKRLFRIKSLKNPDKPRYLTWTDNCLKVETQSDQYWYFDLKNKNFIMVTQEQASRFVGKLKHALDNIESREDYSDAPQDREPLFDTIIAEVMDSQMGSHQEHKTFQPRIN